MLCRTTKAVLGEGGYTNATFIMQPIVTTEVKERGWMDGCGDACVYLKQNTLLPTSRTDGRKEWGQVVSSSTTGY